MSALFVMLTPPARRWASSGGSYVNARWLYIDEWVAATADA